MNNSTVEQTITDFSELRDVLERYSCAEEFDPKELDRLTIELLKVVELKKIASILAGNN